MTVACNHRSLFLFAVIPNADDGGMQPQVISKSSSVPPGSSQSKWKRRLASASSMTASPNVIPGQILRPAPNGTSSKSAPRKSTAAAAPSSNLSGRNSSASGPQLASSRPMAHTLTSTMAPCGTSYPRTRRGSRHSRGRSSGATACSRSVSLITLRKYGSSCMDSSPTRLCPASAPRTSACALRSAAGFRNSSAMAHCSVDAEVSLPAPMRSLITARMVGMSRGAPPPPSRSTSRMSSSSSPPTPAAFLARFSLMTASMSRDISPNTASTRRAVPLSARARRDDGNRSARLNPAATLTASSRHARKASRSAIRSPTTARTAASATYVATRELTFTAAPDAASAATDATRTAASASRVPRNVRTRGAPSSSVAQSLRTARQCSPCGARAIPRPSAVRLAVVSVRGRVAKAASWVFITSLAAAADEATTTGSSPMRSSMSGPCRRARSRMAWCGSAPTRWCRLPITGSCHGPGGGFRGMPTCLRLRRGLS
ncbi:hypothetical protein VPH35_132800 [Triticum aestivum]